jgi:hypothetical protein
MKTLGRASALFILLFSIHLTFAQDTAEPIPTAEVPIVATEVPILAVETPATNESFAISSSVMTLIMFVIGMGGMVTVSVMSVHNSGGTAKEALKAGAVSGIRGLISNPDLSGTIETRLLAIPEAQRKWVIELVNLASPITSTSTISADAAQWIKNVMDGNPDTGAVLAQSTLDMIDTKAIQNEAPFSEIETMG